MLGSLFDNSTLPMLEQVVGFTQARHGVLAGNVANLDTPGYRTRDLSVAEFQEQLKAAVKQHRTASQRAPYPSFAPYQAQGPYESAAPYESHAPYELQAPYPTPQVATPTSPWAAKEVKDYQGMLRHDDNNSSVEEQVTEIAKNHAQHNLALSLMTAQFRLLRAAITERA